MTAPWPLLKEGTILDTALIATRSLPWNNTGARDAEMHHNKKCYLCTSMKAHLGVDAELALAHTIICAAANVNDAIEAHALVHGEESGVSADTSHHAVE